MDSNDFNFGDFDSFAGNSNDSFDNSGGFNTANDFGSNGGFGDASDFDVNLQGQNSIPDDAFSGAFDNNNNNQNQNADNTMDDGLKKKAVVAVVVGVVGIVGVIALATVLNKNTANKQVVETGQQQIAQQQVTQQVVQQQVPSTQQYSTGQDASQLMSKPANQSNSKTDSSWTEITESEAVEFSEDYMEVMYTVTGIKHYAKKVDASGVLIMKTTLTGTLAGYPGTYTIDIPYEKGKALSVGTYFNVAIQVGSYKGTTVIGDITTYLQ